MLPTCPTPALLIDARNTLGESPRWHTGERALYWTDIAEQRLHRWDAATATVVTRQFDQPVGCFAFRAGGGLLLGMKDGCAVIDDLGDEPRAVGDQPLAGRPHHRMNDGRTDPMGRFWVGSVNGAKDANDAALYCLDTDEALTEIEGGMLTCNGAAFFADLSSHQKLQNASRPLTEEYLTHFRQSLVSGLSTARFCHADTPSHAVRIYDFDGIKGSLSNRRILHQFTPGVGPGLGRPDGGSFDAEGCYWTALFDGWRVVRLSPAGEILRDIPLPVQRPTMIAFGGDDGCTAFVTSARTGLGDAELADQPGAGGVFTFTVDVPGVPEWLAEL